MIRFTGKSHDGRPIYGLGLSAENVRRLRDHQPIFFDAVDMGIDGFLFIFAGETEEAMTRRLHLVGLVEEHVNVHAPDAHYDTDATL